MNAGQIARMLTEHHPAPEWACFPEVPSGTGGGRRRIDLLCCNLWKSRGFEIRGIEIKVSRADFNRELKAPDKADDVARYCDTFWIAAPKGVVEPDKLPMTWGLFEVSEKAVRVAVKAEKRDPDQLTRAFVASLFRSAHRQIGEMQKFWVPRTEIQNLIEEARERGAEEAPDTASREILRLEMKLSYAKPILAELGLDLDQEQGWGGLAGPRDAAALRLGRIILGGRDGGDYYRGFGQVAKVIADCESQLASARSRIETLLEGKGGSSEESKAGRRGPAVEEEG